MVGKRKYSLLYKLPFDTNRNLKIEIKTKERAIYKIICKVTTMLANKKEAEPKKKPHINSYGLKIPKIGDRKT